MVGRLDSGEEAAAAAGPQLTHSLTPPPARTRPSYTPHLSVLPTRFRVDQSDGPAPLPASTTAELLVTSAVRARAPADHFRSPSHRKLQKKRLLQIKYHLKI
ncbi:uncharacterized protein LOC144601140 [Rhinoraja longicauda]